VDDGYNDDGGPLTGAKLGYSQVRDGSGHALEVGDPPVEVQNVPTDGRRVSLSFQVARAAGKRVIYPVPYSPELRYSAITVRSNGAQPSCLRSSALENGRMHYSRCQLGTSGEVPNDDGWAPEKIRLELLG
jgi:hypothetical protein